MMNEELEIQESEEAQDSPDAEEQASDAADDASTEQVAEESDADDLVETAAEDEAAQASKEEVQDSSDAEEQASDAADDASSEQVAEEADADDLAEAEAEDKEAQALREGSEWFVVHCYSGYENKVRHAIEQRIDTMGMQDKIFDVVVPTEEEIEVRDGKRRTIERRVFPGYILVQMHMDEDSWYVVRNTPGVTGFVGMGTKPTPLRPEEVSRIIKRMEAEAPKIKLTFKEGQQIRIIDGPFNDFIGIVDEIDMDKGKVRALVSFFGRETPVELDFLQVEKA